MRIYAVVRTRSAGLEVIVHILTLGARSGVVHVLIILHQHLRGDLLHLGFLPHRLNLRLHLIAPHVQLT